jgi:alkanesulfonate monooxygenase SsuD/methylene tetrahydromethanopterin reductase-like flavin-dependent oxidoreductase (luciferase family)
VIEAAIYCERLGYDSVWLYDHLSPYWSPSRPALECWTALSAVAVQTSKVKVGSLVTNVILRNPALLAKMSSTVDNISDGRLMLGIGTGDKLSRDELCSYGYGFPSFEERVERLKECIQILKGMWGEGPTSFHGKHYTIEGALNLPKPKQLPHPSIWVGGKHRRILDVVAELADGWNFWGMSIEAAKQRSSYLSEKCSQYGRKPGEVLKSWSGTYKELSQGTEDHPEESKTVASRLRYLTDAEIEYFIVSFDSTATPEAYQTFADAMSDLS